MEIFQQRLIEQSIEKILFNRISALQRIIHDNLKVIVLIVRYFKLQATKNRLLKIITNPDRIFLRNSIGTCVILIILINSLKYFNQQGHEYVRAILA